MVCTRPLLDFLGSLQAQICVSLSCTWHGMRLLTHSPPQHPVPIQTLMLMLGRRYAWHRLFGLTRAYNKNLSSSDTQGMACSVLLAALAIPPYDETQTEGEAELQRERSARMASILGIVLVSSPVHKLASEITSPPSYACLTGSLLQSDCRHRLRGSFIVIRSALQSCKGALCPHGFYPRHLAGEQLLWCMLCLLAGGGLDSNSRHRLWDPNFDQGLTAELQRELSACMASIHPSGIVLVSKSCSDPDIAAGGWSGSQPHSWATRQHLAVCHAGGEFAMKLLLMWSRQ